MNFPFELSQAERAWKLRVHHLMRRTTPNNAQIVVP